MNFNNKTQKKSTKSVLQGMALVGFLLSCSLVRTAEAGGVAESAAVEEVSQSTSAVVSNGSGDLPLDSISTAHYTSASYEYKQCTWWAYNRARDFGIAYGETMGNGMRTLCMGMWLLWRRCMRIDLFLFQSLG
ncbi:hypothetical protein [Lactococcus petauri]|uniref:hypothetical protein n=1 Tax=Lactococcus petauri TaxID=1940789 RepID=UPI00254EF155|nr:hypothetical protein [Lactococcus petauri]